MTPWLYLAVGGGHGDGKLLGDPTNQHRHRCHPLHAEAPGKEKTIVTLVQPIEISWEKTLRFHTFSLRLKQDAFILAKQCIILEKRTYSLSETIVNANGIC